MENNKNDNGVNVVLSKNQVVSILDDISWATSNLDETITKFRDLELKKELQNLDNNTYNIIKQIKKIDEYNIDVNNTLEKLNDLDKTKVNLDYKIEELKKTNKDLISDVNDKIADLNKISDNLEKKASVLNIGLNYKAIIISFVIGCFIAGSAVQLLDYKQIATLQVKVFMLQKAKKMNTNNSNNSGN